jgi:Lon protease-like protein
MVEPCPNPHKLQPNGDNADMRGDLLPLFPLETVLLPRAPLPLHIFEDRYKEMMRDVLRADGEFGVVLAREGGLLNTGCTARIDRIERQYEDGRLDLVAVGQRRFRILSLDTERSYLRAEVEDLEDDDFLPVPDDKLRDALLLHARYALATGSEAPAPDAQEPFVSFLLGAISPDLEFRQLLLGTRSETRRMDMIARHLARLLHRHAVQQAMRATARTNGHGKHRKG